MTQGKPALYAINPDGTGLTKHKITGAINRDWEDIAQDSTYFYIADMGNNFGYRKDLTIYIVQHDFSLVIPSKLGMKAKSLTSVKNTNTTQKPLWSMEILFLFSKNRKSHKTQLYIFPKSRRICAN